MLLALLLLSSSAGADPAVQFRSTKYVCDEAQSFVVRFNGPRATVATADGIYILSARPSSIGKKFLSEDAAFIQDEDRGVLIVPTGQPYVGCREAKGRLRVTMKGE